MSARRSSWTVAGLTASVFLALLASVGTPGETASRVDLSRASGGDEIAPVRSVVSIGLTVADLDRSVAFFHDVLGFEKRAEIEVAGDALEHLEGVFGARVRRATLQLGAESIELSEYLAPRGRPIPADSSSNDRWFQHIAIVVSDMDAAYAKLREHKVEHASSGPQTLPNWNPNAGGIRAFYFKDPDQHVLEVIWFPPGKGDPRWQAKDGPLFRGIDHTAIVVESTQRSLEFYCDQLGLRVAGTSENYGTEQEHLNNVFGARLAITGLRASSGPGIELLEYLAPRGGRPYPSDARANDLVHWETRLLAPDLARTAQQLHRASSANLVSPGVVSFGDAALGFHHGLGITDPDGHVLQLIQL